MPKRPALAVMVDNYTSARPQSGIQHADVVFEQPVEAYITRWVVVFQCHGAAEVGDIRSARNMDVSLLAQLSHPIYVHAGGIPPVESNLNNSPNLINVNFLGYPAITDHPPGRYAPYDTYASTSSLWGLYPKDTTPPSPLFGYSTRVPSGAPATSVHVPISGTSDITWTYDPQAKQYLLSYSGVPATTASGQQIAASNVVVQVIQIFRGPWAEDAAGTLEVQAKLTGSGPLEVFRNGVEVAGQWERTAREYPTQLLDSKGQAIKLQPGLTWVELTPSTTQVTVAQAGGSGAGSGSSSGPGGASSGGTSSGSGGG